MQLKTRLKSKESLLILVRNVSNMLVVKIICLYFVIFCLSGCTSNSEFDEPILKEFSKCNENKDCIIDLAKAFNFEWDTAYYLSGKYSLEEINNYIGFEIEHYTDVGARIIFVNKGRDVYSYEWFPSFENAKNKIYILTDLEKFKFNRSNAKFKIEKINEVIVIEQPPFENSKVKLLNVIN